MDVIAHAVAHSRGLDVGTAHATARRVHARIGKSLGEYRVEDDRGRSVDVVCKVYREAERGRAAFELLRSLGVLLAPDPSLRVVTPIAWLPERRALIMERAPGSTLHDRLVAEPQDTLSAERAAEWLTALHRLPPPPLLPHDGRRTALALPRLIAELGAVVAPPLGERIAATAQAIEATRPLVRRREVLRHGDFHPRNVYVGDGPSPSVVVIDVDHASLGDADWDVAYHLGQLRVAAFDQWGDFDRLARVAHAFGARYASDLDDERRHEQRRRVPALVALTVLESLHFRRVILRSPDAAIDEAFIDDAATALVREPW